MARRSRSREIALQVLYQDDLNPQRNLSDSEEFVRKRLQYDKPLVKFAGNLISGVRRNRQELDKLLSSYAENWS